MRRLLLNAPPLFVLAFVLTGCGEKPASENSFFPLAEGKRWTYKIEISFDDPEAHVDTSTLTLTNLGRVTLNNAEAWKRRSDSGNEYWLRADDTGVFRVASRSPTAKTATLDPAPRMVIPAKLDTHQTWSVTTVPYFLKRRSEWPPEFRYIEKYQNMTMKYSVASTNQEVTTPAGKYTGCLVLKGVADLNVWVETDMTYKEVPMTNVEWYCPNVGLVQLERIEPTTARFFQGGVMRMSLISTH